MGSKKSKQKPQELEQPPPPGPRDDNYAQQPQKRKFIFSHTVRGRYGGLYCNRWVIFYNFWVQKLQNNQLLYDFRILDIKFDKKIEKSYFIFVKKQNLFCWYFAIFWWVILYNFRLYKIRPKTVLLISNNFISTIIFKNDFLISSYYIF